MASSYQSKDLPPGTTLREWELEDVLGRGGFAIVYKARHKHFGDSVAIKEFFPSEMTDRIDGFTVAPTNASAEVAFEFGRHKFLEEAKILYRLSQPRRHPNLVCVKALFELNGTAYIVMDFESGQPLSRQLKVGRQFNEKTLTSIFRKVILGLDLAHQAGVWHRDIKPANILVDEHDHPVLIDFGAAKVEDSSEKTQTKLTFYTPGYAAFEQYVKKQPIGPWTDIYALGVTLYLCVTGKKPDEPLDRLGDPGTPLADGDWPGFSKHFLRWIDKAMAVMPLDRPQSLAAWLQLLDDRPADEDPATQGLTETHDDDETQWRAYDAAKPDIDTDSQRSTGASVSAPAPGATAGMAPQTGMRSLSRQATEGTVFATQTSSKLAALWGAARADLALVKDVAVEREANAVAAIERAATIAGGDALAVPLRDLLEAARSASAETQAVQQVLEAAQNVNDAETAHENGVSARQAWRQALGRTNTATTALHDQLDGLQAQLAQLADIQAHCTGQSAALAGAAAEAEQIAETARRAAQALADPAAVLVPLDVPMHQLQQARAAQAAIYIKIAEATDLATAEHGLATLAALKADFDAAARAVQAASTTIHADIAAALEAQRQQALQAVAAMAAAEAAALTLWQAAVTELERRQTALADRARAFAGIDLAAAETAGADAARAGETVRAALAAAAVTDDPVAAQAAVKNAQTARTAAETGLESWRTQLAGLDGQLVAAEAAALAAAEAAKLAKAAAEAAKAAELAAELAAAEAAAVQAREAAAIAALAAAAAQSRDQLGAQLDKLARDAGDTKLAADDVGIAASALIGLDAGLARGEDALRDADAAIALLSATSDRLAAEQYTAQVDAASATGAQACASIATALAAAGATIAARNVALQAVEQAAAITAQIVAMVAPDAGETAAFAARLADGQARLGRLVADGADVPDAGELTAPLRAALAKAEAAGEQARHAHGLLAGATTLAAAERAVTQALDARANGDALLATLPALAQDCDAAIGRTRAAIVAAREAAEVQAAAAAAADDAADDAAADDDDADRTVLDTGEPDEHTLSSAHEAQSPDAATDSPRDAVASESAATDEDAELDEPTRLADRGIEDRAADVAENQDDQDETRIAGFADDVVIEAPATIAPPSAAPPPATPKPATLAPTSPTSDSPPPITPQIAASASARPVAAAAPEPTKKSPMLLIIIAVVVVAAAVLGFMLFGHSTKDTGSSPATSEGPAQAPSEQTPAAGQPSSTAPAPATPTGTAPVAGKKPAAPVVKDMPAPEAAARKKPETVTPKLSSEAIPSLPKPEPAKPEPAKPEPVRPEPAKQPEPARPEPPKPEPAKQEAPKAIAPTASGLPPCVRPDTTSAREWIATKRMMKADGKCS